MTPQEPAWRQPRAIVCLQQTSRLKQRAWARQLFRRLRFQHPGPSSSTACNDLIPVEAWPLFRSSFRTLQCKTARVRRIGEEALNDGAYVLFLEKCQGQDMEPEITQLSL